MSNLVNKLRDSLQNDGLGKTIHKVIVYPFVPLIRRRTRRKREEMLRLGTPGEKFLAIYQDNLWNSTESASGVGSTLRYTENLRKELPKLVAEFSIKKIFDAPCGDFNWMRHLLQTIDVDYIGADIVKPIIDSNREKFLDEKISFIDLDLTRDSFPSADLMICRDCLFHLSYDDTKSVLKNFVESGIPYLLTTTYKNTNSFLNKDISTGNFRVIDLFSAPYNFPAKPLAAIDDWIPPDPERQMCLWSREQVFLALTGFNQTNSTAVLITDRYKFK